MILERGALLNNRYRIVEILGQGGMGSVYRAVDENLGVEVAVKDNLFTTDEYARQFRREAIILANLRHPNLPRVTDHFVMEGQGQYLVMDYIEGEDLRQRMDRVGVISEDEAITIGAAICDALAYLSSRNPAIVHRDIKPGNVKIAPTGQIFLVDFGLAKVLMGSQATTTGARAMTPGYSPPEQYGTARTDCRSDIFSLGATLYASLTGAIPEDALARAMDQTELTPLRKRNPRVSRKLAVAIEKSLSVRPDDRFQMAEDFKQALLSARSNTRRRNGDLVVEPPPKADDLQVEEEGERLPSSVEALLPKAEERSPLHLAISAPLDEPAPSRPRSRPRRRDNRRGCWWIFAVLGVMVMGGSLGAYVFDPNLPARAISGLLAGAQSPTPTLQATQAITATLAPAGNSTQAAVDFPLDVASPTPTWTLTAPPPTAFPTPTLTPSPTLVGGGGGQLAFASDVRGVVQIYTINLDGSDLRQVTQIPEGACQPDWSPDGKRIVFISPCDTNVESYPGSAMFLINADGTGLEPLPTVPGGDYDPDWSPDGTRIAFTSIRKSGRPQIYVYNLADRSVQMVSDPETYSRDMQPAWSPDGKRIAYVTTRRGPYQIWTMTADGLDQQILSHSRDLINATPAWSPDGLLVLFTQTIDAGGIPRVMVLSLDEGGLREYRLYQDSTPMREARYSPDGLWIALEAWPKGSDHDIYLMAANGAGLTRLTKNPRSDFDPAWRPQVKTP